MQLDLLAAQVAKVEAIERVERNADEQWKRYTLGVIQGLAMMGGEFTTDDVWQQLEGAPVQTHEPRAMGAVIKQAAAAGFIKATDGWATSQRPECHGRPIKVWRSAWA